MSIYGNYLNESSNMMNINNIDLYDYIHQECTNMKSMIESGNLSIEEQVALLEAFDLKAFLKNIVVKFKEVVKTLLAKIKQISTKFVTGGYANIWKEKIDDDRLWEALYKSLSSDFMDSDGKTKLEKINFSLIRAIPILPIEKIIEKTKTTDDRGDFFELGDKNVVDFDGFNDKNNIIKIEVNAAETLEEFKSKNTKLLPFIRSNINNIINVIQGKYIYDFEKLAIKFQSEFERYINKLANKTDDGQYDKDAITSVFKRSVSFLNKGINATYRNFSRCIKITNNIKPGAGGVDAKKVIDTYAGIKKDTSY